MVFNKASKTDAKIIHEGMITAKQAGLVGLVAPSVENSDIITSKVGKVKLASGDSFTIDINTGSTEEWLRINAPITELYDVAFLPEMRQPRAVSLRKKEEISAGVFIENGL